MVKVKTMICLIVLSLPLFSGGMDLVKHFKNVHTSKYFVFHYNDDVTETDSFAVFSDGFIDVINRKFFRTDFPYPIHVYVLNDRPSFQRFLVEKAGVSDPPGWGIYFPEIKSFVTYQGSGYGTFAHEIMHPLVRYNLRAAPVWADEGIPSFFEKSFGYWDEGQLTLSFGVQNPWRIKEMGNKILLLDLADIVRNGEKYGTSEKRMVAVFLYENGRLERYLKQVKLNQKDGYGTFLEAAFQRSMMDITPLWKKYLQDVYNRRDEFSLVPASEIFNSKAQYETFMKLNHFGGR